MKYKVGEILHFCHKDWDTGRLSYSKYKIRSKRNDKFHAILIDEYTWVKRKWGKDQTYGWASSIPDWCRESCKVGEKFYGLFRTKKQAKAFAEAGYKRMKERQAKRDAEEKNNL